MEYLLTIRDTDHRMRDDRAHMRVARQAAEALFRPKAPAQTRPAPDAPHPANQSTKRPRILRAVEPAPRNPEHLVVAPLAAGTPAAPSIPPSELPRIKTWLKYGMTMAEVAQLYGLAIHDLERLL